MTQRGFTLIEALVAFVILSLALTVCFQAISAGLSQSRAASTAAARVLTARSILDAVGVEAPLEEGVREGALGSGESWRLTVSRVRPATTGGPALFRADLSLFDRGRPTVALSALKLGE